MSNYCLTGLQTSIPWREWHEFHVASVKIKERYLYLCNLAAEATTDHYNYGRVGNYKTAGVHYSYHTLFKPRNDFSLCAGADSVVTMGLYYRLMRDELSWGSISKFSPVWQVLGDPPAGGIDYSSVSSLYYDGVNEWPSYATDDRWRASWSAQMNTQAQGSPCPQCALGPPPTNCPDVSSQMFSGYQWLFAWFTGIVAHNWQEEFFTNGGELSQYLWYDGDWWAFPNNGEISTWFSEIESVKVYYFNPVVNIISPARYPTSGSDLVLTGLGFILDNDDISVYHWGAENWKDHVYKIQFIGKQGQGTFEIEDAAFPTVKFNLTNTTITIPAAQMPALTKGTYEIKLIKMNEESELAHMDEPEAYAGDWRVDSSGHMERGERLVLWVYDLDDRPPKPDKPIVLTDWEFPGEVPIFMHLAPIDTRAPDVFYDGFILNVGSLKRSLNDRTGLYSISDMTLDLQNDTLIWSEMMARYNMKDALVSVFHAWADEPEAWKTQIHKMIINDYELEANVFRVFLKDVTRKYLELKIPEYFITEDDYPDAHEDAYNKGMSEILGASSLTTGDSPGSYKAQYVDTVNFYYLASRGSLHAVPEVYSDGVLMATPADYSVNYRDGGRTYIDFVGDQGNNKITFNAEGYMLAAWNSTNGYIQNPVRILQFILMILLHMPGGNINMDSFQVMADYFDDQGWSTNGKFWAESITKSDEKISDFLFTFGIKLFPDKEGRLKVDMKNRTGWHSDYFIIEQTDAITPARNTPTLRRAENYVRYIWDEHPAATLFSGADSARRESSIADFDAILEAAGSPWKFPYTDDAAMIDARVQDELLKRGYGEKGITITLSIQKTTELDIFDNFRLQSLFAPSISRAGQRGWYYYVISIEYSWQNNKITIEAVDLQWLFRKCMIIGNFAELTRDWADANDYQRLFAYIGDCTTGTFPDGEANKKICDCD